MAGSESTCEQALSHHVRLILDNDEALYRWRREIVQDALAQSNDDESEILTSAQVAEQRLEVRLADWCADLAGLDEWSVEVPQDAQLSQLARELLTTALAFVDWREMARDYIEEEMGA